ncbi:sigma-70 family RNA polymerase sigma factor [Hymenobacter aquaticus]|uniref:Sigma-70 family RNA polymerase sigma factor n=1 Tax=Hymenobacter aquaticus TaxID=1867101 RepID=A0A4Z0PU29_9BACT|nr:sigma-70 family RNA polymerase sigma factor [Hymenobacter aquaticus]TGE20764.1 sigma-70 family RNA polymerase sigma factor [Hymenobacter aquaticus]
MNQPLAEALTHLRMGNQSFLITFYEEQRDHFARWARRQHQLEPAAAHELLRGVLVDFYDQVADGRLTKLPPDLRNYLYGMAQEQIQAQKTTAELPQVEAGRRQLLLRVFSQLGPDCQQVLMYFYFRGYNFEKVAGKMGFANATVARIQKTSCLRKLLDLQARLLSGGGAEAGASAAAV